jgi:hypothetical protein
LSELQYALAMVPGVEGYGESYAWRSLEKGETRTEETGKDQAPEHEPFPVVESWRQRNRDALSRDISHRWYAR